MNGYAGRVLYVDLTTGKTRTEKLNERRKEVHRWHRLRHEALACQLQGRRRPLRQPACPRHWGQSQAPCSQQAEMVHAFISKSPETYAVGEAVSHGTFGAELKRAGYDAVILTGKSEKLVFLWIDDDSVQLLDAAHLGQISLRNRRHHQGRTW